jgi:hypothetical protein
MGVGLEPLTGQLRILRRLLRLVDPQFAILIEETSPLPYWAISPLMTLYTHDLPTLALAQRVMDWILSRPPDAVIYLVAAVSWYLHLIVCSSSNFNCNYSLLLKKGKVSSN